VTNIDRIKLYGFPRNPLSGRAVSALAATIPKVKKIKSPDITVRLQLTLILSLATVGGLISPLVFQQSCEFIFEVRHV
jgi:hypothetical protein